MLDIKFHKDLRHNFLILKCVEPPEDKYQCKMITGNHIKGLLSCQERHINGEMLLYYEISSRQNMQSMFENKSITMKQLRALLIQLKLTYEDLSKYLLNESCLILKPEYIFADIEAEQFDFLYNPFEPDEDYLFSLLEYLLDKVDSEDKDAVEIAYKMFELAQQEQFVLDEILQWFEQDYGDDRQNEINQDACQAFQFNSEEVCDENIIVSEEKQENSSRRSKKKWGYLSLVTGLVLCAALFYIYNMYYMGEEEKRYFFIALTGATGLSAGGTLWILYINFIAEKINMKKKMPDLREKDKGKNHKEYQTVTGYEQIQEKAQQSFGNTVFIPWAENCENKLYGQGNKNHIDLNRLPVTVGKLAGSVDMVIADTSISRKHARFFRQGTGIYMTDLNSTNGTFKNGLRLEPNSTESLEPGDEIRLGKLKFIYR